jgi:very-short-patch-repair endonuclease
MTDAEAFLWVELRRRQLGCLYRRQHPVGPYFADFACRRHRVVIEWDGNQHAGSAHDSRRDESMRCSGWTILRFWNTEVLAEPDMVVSMIRHACHPAEK